MKVWEQWKENYKKAEAKADKYVKNGRSRGSSEVSTPIELMR